MVALNEIIKRKQADQALREVVRRLQMSARAGNVGLWNWDLSTNKVSFSPEWKRQIGYREDEISDDYAEWESRLHPDDRAATLAALQEYFDGDRDEYKVEFRLRHKDGSYRWILAQGELADPTDDDPPAMLGSHVDITARRNAEDALRRSEANLADAQSFAKLGSWERDLVSGDGIWSAEMRRLFGYPPDSQGQSFDDFLGCVHPDDRRQIVGTYETILLTGQSVTHEFRSNPARGPLRHFHTTVAPVKDAEDCVVKLKGTVLDVTERRAAYDLLAASELRFRETFDDAPVAMVWLNRDGCFAKVNHACCALFGYAEEELIGQSIFGLDHLKGFDQIEDVIEALWSGRLDRIDIERHFLRTDGSVLSLQISAKIIRDHRDEALHLLAHLQDITLRKQAEGALRRSEAGLALAQRTAGLGSWEHDLDTGNVIWSAEMYRLFRVPLGGPLPSFKDVLKSIHPDDRQLLTNNHQTMLRTGRGTTVEYRSNPERGPMRHFSAAATPIRDSDSRIVKLTGTLLDITLRKEAEEQLLQAHKMEAIGQFASGIAHDFNNMLVPIKALTQLTKMKLPADSPLQENLDAIQEAATRAADLVKKIMGFSRQDEPQAGLIDISACLADVMALVRNVLPATINLMDEVRPDVGMVIGDAAQLQSVILNMAANAAYAIEGKVGRLTIGLARLSADAELAGRHPALTLGQAPAKIVIADTGHGMDGATLKKIFEPFFTTKPPGEGTGLGLAMVHGVVSAMGGVIEAASTVGIGTTFEIYLPLNDGETAT